MRKRGEEGGRKMGEKETERKEGKQRKLKKGEVISRKA